MKTADYWCANACRIVDDGYTEEERGHTGETAHPRAPIETLGAAATNSCPKTVLSFVSPGAKQKMGSGRFGAKNIVLFTIRLAGAVQCRRHPYFGNLAAV